jgi:hypothetical protein
MRFSPVIKGWSIAHRSTPPVKTPMTAVVPNTNIKVAKTQGNMLNPYERGKFSRKILASPIGACTKQAKTNTS